MQYETIYASPELPRRPWISFLENMKALHAFSRRRETIANARVSHQVVTKPGKNY